jgi:hypothetical protein
MGSIDLREAYYSVSIAEEDRQYLRFIWRGVTYQYRCLPFGLTSAPRIFTKLLKPVFGTLRNLGYLSVAYIDDSYIQGETYSLCQDNINVTRAQLDKLGFLINYEKSVLKPCQSIVFLGFILNSKHMTISLTEKKIQNFLDKYHNIYNKIDVIIRQVAELIGIMVSYAIAIPFGPLFVKQLESEKVEALRNAKGNFDSYMIISTASKQDLKWWADNIKSSGAPISRGMPSHTLTTDASGEGWGAVLDNSVEQTGGRWSLIEHGFRNNINYLELKATLLGLMCFQNVLSGHHIRLRIDNVTAVAYINHMGGTKSALCNKLSREIWLFAMHHNMWLSAVHLPGVLNCVADRESRVFHDATEWMLSRDIFDTIMRVFFTPCVDLFASKLNNQVVKYFSWRPDPDAYAVDAVMYHWEDFRFYAFPPFSVLERVLQKVRLDKAEGLLVVPRWPTQNWYPVLLRMCASPPRLIPRGKRSLVLPYKTELVHPLYKKLQLMVCHISGSVFRDRGSLMTPYPL